LAWRPGVLIMVYWTNYSLPLFRPATTLTYSWASMALASPTCSSSQTGQVCLKCEYTKVTRTSPNTYDLKTHDLKLSRFYRYNTEDPQCYHDLARLRSGYLLPLVPFQIMIGMPENSRIVLMCYSCDLT